MYQVGSGMAIYGSWGVVPRPRGQSWSITGSDGELSVTTAGTYGTLMWHVVSLDLSVPSKPRPVVDLDKADDLNGCHTCIAVETKST